VAAFTGLPALADDSGLVVDVLGGAPGVHSARYAGPDASDQQNLERLLLDLRRTRQAVDHQPDNLQSETTTSARFICVISLATPEGRCHSFTGSVEGTIASQPHGSNGFGYDPVFVPEGFKQTFAQMSAKDKDALSHRGRALSVFAKALTQPNNPLLS